MMFDAQETLNIRRLFISNGILILKLVIIYTEFESVLGLSNMD